jgi:hypothetical protein
VGEWEESEVRRDGGGVRRKSESMSITISTSDRVSNDHHQYQSAQHQSVHASVSISVSEYMSDTGEGQYRVSVTWPSRR